jgi:hypothetical protein
MAAFELTCLALCIMNACRKQAASRDGEKGSVQVQQLYRSPVAASAYYNKWQARKQQLCGQQLAAAAMLLSGIQAAVGSRTPHLGTTVINYI